uniref:WD repeat domain 25 n=1 Tax=Erpetoichthys calabaricus TaxID=27687 RepID=A0A8C4TB04_ERPCA
MTSLVEYEDSDSENDRSGPENPRCSSVTLNGCEPNISGCSSLYSEADCFQDVSRHAIRHNLNITSSVSTQVESVHKVQNVQFSLHSYHNVNQGTGQRYAQVEHRPPAHNIQKRSFQLKDGNPRAVKPYVPKRLRVGPSVCGMDSGNSSGNEVNTMGEADSAILSEASVTLRAHLGTRYAATEIPRAVLFQMAAHQGPVNKVQWCPVQQYSHLLLSASMDHTVKIWNAVDTGKCRKTYTSHGGAVRDIQWSPCGSRILTGSFDSEAHVTDVETGQQLEKLRNEFKITCLSFLPGDQNIFVCGGFGPEVKAWDTRIGKVIRSYKARVQQTLDILFLPEGQEFVTSSDCVSRDSADRTLIAWDFQTASKISNQIYQERYTCPSLTLHPKDDVFAAQTNGNYVALFSAQRPYKMNKKKRFEGHKVEGYAVSCEFSPDGTLLATGSSQGIVYFYSYATSRMVRTLSAHKQACVCVTFHPVLPSVAATCDWSGEVAIWH